MPDDNLDLYNHFSGKNHVAYKYALIPPDVIIDAPTAIYIYTHSAAIGGAHLHSNGVV